MKNCLNIARMLGPLPRLLSRLLLGSLCLIGLCAAALAAPPALPEDSHKAVILAYHRIGEESFFTDNLSAGQFAAHIEEIKNGGYHVLPLETLLESLGSDTPLPPRTLAITFEGGYLSAFRNAMPLLLENRIPFTVFYASDLLDCKTPEYMSWEDLTRLSKNETVGLGVLPASYTHTARQPRQEMIGSLNRARQRFRETFGHEVNLLSYPYGEYALELKELARSQGFKFALGLHSGAAHAGSDPYALPRFSMTERYGDIERFRMVADSLPLPVTGMEPADPLLHEGEWIAGFTLPAALEKESRSLSCFISGQKPPLIQRLGRRIEIRSAEPALLPGRIRMNCTMPGPTAREENGEEGETSDGEDAADEPRWRWLGFIYHSANGKNESDADDESPLTELIPPRDEPQELQE